MLKLRVIGLKLVTRVDLLLRYCFAFIHTISIYYLLNFRYKFAHDADMSTVATAQLLSNTLYKKRFFPYYALALVAGLDAEGAGYVAGYDAVGSYLRSREGYGANGSAAQLLMPILDNSFGSIGVTSGLQNKPEYSKDEVVEIVKSAFVTCGERDIMCGDGVDILVITKTGTEEIFFELKRD
jgi:20S proteasome subunit beta 6